MGLEMRESRGEGGFKGFGVETLERSREETEREGD
jgi:hypothetical protein